MRPTEIEFQRVGLLAVLTQFATNPNIDLVTKLSIKEAVMAVLDEHPVGDTIEEKVKSLIR